MTLCPCYCLRQTICSNIPVSCAPQIVFGLDPGYRKYVMAHDKHRILELAAANEVGATVTWQFIRDYWAELVSARGPSA